MGQLTETMMRKLSGFRNDIKDALLADLNAHEEIDALSSDGACSLTVLVTELSVTGTDAYTLAAPTRTGQRKIIRCVLAASTPAATLTITSPDTTTGFVNRATYFFDTVGQEITLEATAGLLWRCVDIKRAGGDIADKIVVGTTAITNKMWAVYALSITGTVNSTLPNGTCVGERITVICTTAASTPIGGLAGAFKGGAGIAYTALGAIGVVASTTVTGDTAILEWDGAAWNVMYQSGCTLS
jgi:hypothetical protein